MNHVWGPVVVAPWGPFEFIDMANALDVMPILTLATDTNTPDDWADLVECKFYAIRKLNAHPNPDPFTRGPKPKSPTDMYGDETTTWGAVRIHNDSHPAPFKIDTFELGNEQSVLREKERERETSRA